MTTNQTFTLTKQGERQPLTFTQISESEVQVCYGNNQGQWIGDMFYAAIVTVRPIEFARQLWKQYRQMGWVAA